MDVDVIIVGAGPAGCSAALFLLARNYTVAVISVPDSRKGITETSNPILKRMLNSMDAGVVLSACEPCFGIISNWDRKDPILRPSIGNPFGPAWFVHRPQFDILLQKQMCDRGALCIEERALELSIGSTSVCVTTDKRAIAGRWTIIATGSPAWAGRATGQKPVSMDTLIGFWALLPKELNERLFKIEAVDYGWWYLCPSNAKNALACCVTDAIAARESAVNEVGEWNTRFKRTQISQEFDNETKAQIINAISASTISLPIKSGHLWTVVGDASVKLDPIGSSGIVTALVSGRRAAAVVADTLSNKVPRNDEYTRWGHGLLEEFIRERRKHYAIQARRFDSAFWKRRLDANVSQKQMSEN